MAELVVGTTIGGVSLAAALSGTFLSVIECIGFIQFGRRFGKDFDKYQARLCALKLQTTRWGVCAGALPNPKTGRRRRVIVDQQTATAVWRLWSAIKDDLDNMERKSKTYIKSEPEDLEVFETGDMTDWTRVLSSQTKTIVANRMGDVSLTDKAKWAIFNKKYFDRLLEDIAENFGQLKGLLPQLVEPLQQLCRIEVEELQNTQSQEAIEMLRETSWANQDTMLAHASGQVLVNRGSGHR